MQKSREPKRRNRTVRIFLAAVLLAAALGLGAYIHAVYSIPVLMYHSIDANADRSLLSVSPESFERQLQYLREHNFQVLPLAAYVDAIEQRRDVRHAAVITFDDGFENNYTQAFPLLKKYGLPATVFMVADWIGKPGYLNWEQLREMAQSGLITIGSHTLTHCTLSEADPDVFARELAESKKILEEGLGTPVDFVCYPCGAFSPAVMQAVRRAGYRGACATNPGMEAGRNNQWAIRRIRISQSADRFGNLALKLSGYYNYLRERKYKHKW